MLPKLEHVRYQKTRGKVYAYFNTGKKKPNGQPLYAALPSISCASFWQSYASFKAAREKRAKPGATFADLLKDYRASEAYNVKLSVGSRKTYRSILTEAETLLGDCAVDAMEPGLIRLILEGKKWGGAKANLFVGAIGAVYKWGRANNRATVHPVREIERAATGEHLAWPDEVIEAGLAAEGRLGLAITLLLYTGQRIGDVCKMRWPKGGTISLTQQKTKKALVIPIHEDLRASLDQQPKLGLTILTDERGQAIGTQPIRDQIKAFVTLQGHPELNPHGLRKNAVIALLRAGCTVAEVASITGQNFQMVEYYARQIDQEKMAEAAILKWEQKRPMQTPVKQSV